ncbi:class I tRNA ligase family protein [Candidatus Woesearchaeota archaeon]|nr:class I tRNA ligase family protein [Candidatus Woesearchaeota archaeon]
MKKSQKTENRTPNNKDKHIISKMHDTILHVTNEMESFKLSLAIGKLMDFVNHIYKYRETKVRKQTHDELIKNLILMLSPFTPHLAEEMWEKIKQKDFCSLQQWPKYDESKIDRKAQQSEETIHKTISDINSVLELAKIKQPKKITLIISEEWKYGFMKKIKEQLEKTHNTGDILKTLMQDKELKSHGQDISKLVPKLVKDISKIPNVVLDQETELNNLNDAKKFLKEEFNATIHIIKAEDSKEAKAKQALPSKPAIIVE